MKKADLLKQQARQELLPLLEEHGHEVYTKLEHVSQSGMLRRISVLVQDENGFQKDITSLVAPLTGYNEDKNKPGLRVSGCGMDMGFAVVYNLSCGLYNEPGKYDRDGAYKLKQRWL
jgi:hypothetical protein